MSHQRFLLALPFRPTSKKRLFEGLPDQHTLRRFAGLWRTLSVLREKAARVVDSATVPSLDLFELK